MKRCCDLPACNPKCTIHQFLNQPKTEVGIAADKYYDFMRDQGFGRKLSFHDMRTIFNHFKENWRPK